jgi:hypothetical protein
MAGFFDLQLLSINFYFNLRNLDLHANYALELIFIFHASGRATHRNKSNDILSRNIGNNA